MQMVYCKSSARRLSTRLATLFACALSLMAAGLPSQANSLTDQLVDPPMVQIDSKPSVRTWGQELSERSNQCIDVGQKTNNVNVVPYTQTYSNDAQTISLPKHDFSKQLSQSFVDQFNLQASKLSFTNVSERGRQLVLGAGLMDHWVRFCLQNRSDTSIGIVLSFAPAIIAEIDFYSLSAGQFAYQTGNARPMSTRDIHSAEFSFNVQMPGNSEREFYLRVKARTNAFLEASVSSQKNYTINKDKAESLDGLFVGIFFGLMLYTVLLYVSVRQSSSLFYIASCMALLILFLSIDGRVLQYLLPDDPKIAYFFTVMAYPTSIFASAFFVREFVQLNSYPKIDKIGLIMIGGFAVALIACYQFGYALYFKACALFALIVSIFFGLLSPVYGYFFRGSRQSNSL